MGRKRVGLKVKRSEVVWNLYKEKVFQEIAKLLGVESATEKTEGWLSKRLPAIGNIIKRMTKQELAELEQKVQQIDQEGYDEKVKRRWVRICWCRCR
jgi:hypothetical protein